jgi:serine/threonine protein kinase
LSVEAKDLLKKMMAIDPEDRPSLNQIRKHPFCRTSIQPIIKGLLPNEIIQIEPQFIEQMKAMGYSGFIKDIE